MAHASERRPGSRSGRTTIRGAACGVALFLSSLPAPSSGQIAGMARAGDRVRVAVSDPARPSSSTNIVHDGRLESITADSVVIREGPGSLVRLPRYRVRSVQVPTGTRTQGLEGALLGGVTGLVVPVLAVFMYDGIDACLRGGFRDLLGNNPDWVCRERRERPWGRIASIGAVAGVIVGGLIGRISVTERWENVSVQVTAPPRSAGGVRMGLAIAF